MGSFTSPEPAVARWLAHGVTSLTHPILRYALRARFGPLGIEADWLEAEPFSALEAGFGGWWLRNPRWTAAGVDRSQPAAADFSGVLAHPEWFRLGTDSQGTLSLAPADGAGLSPAAADYLRATDGGWAAIRHSVGAAQWTESFIFGAAGVLLAGGAAAAAYANGDDDAFCAAVRDRLDRPENTRRGAATAAAPGAGDPPAGDTGAMRDRRE